MRSRGRRRRSLRGLGVTLALMLGLLLWARLKLVTETPRMVYADPKAASVEKETSQKKALAPAEQSRRSE